MVGAILDFLADFRYGARVLRRSPGFATVAVAALAVGIGGASSVFTLVNAIILRPLPVPQARELFLAQTHQANEASPLFSWPAFERARDELRGRADVAAASSAVGMQIVPDGPDAAAPARGVVQLVSGEYFGLLRQQPQLGRLLTPADNRHVGAHPVTVVSDGYWRRELGASSGVIGRQLAINGTSFTIVGVTSPSFFGTTVALRSPDAWIPLMMQPVVRYASNASSQHYADTRKPWPPQPDIGWLNLFARVAAPGDAAGIGAVMTVLHRHDEESRLTGTDDAEARQRIASERVVLEPAGRGLSGLRQNVSAPLLVLLAMVGVLLTIACVNVAGLLIARTAAREREIAIRLSIGAGRSRIIRQMLAESLLLSGVGGAVGLALASWGRDLLLALFAPGATRIDLDTGIDWQVVGFSVLVSVVTGVTCGLLPAFRGARVPLSESLKLQGRNLGAGGRRGTVLGKGLVVAQMAFCLLLLVVAGLFIRSMRTLVQSDVGFDRDHLLVARLDIRSMGYSDEQRQALYQRLIERVSAIPGVASSSLSMNGPLAGSARMSSMTVEGYQAKKGEQLLTNEEAVTEAYFATVGLRVLQGRVFGPDDRSPTSHATVINQTMARRFFPNGDGVGKRWSYGPIGPDSFGIIGVVEDARYVELKSAPPNMAYHLTASIPDGVLGDLEIRASGPPARLVSTVRQALAEGEPRLPIIDLLPLAGRIDIEVSDDRMVTDLTAVFGVLALLLACLGLYGTISYGVNRRVAELGLRIALGAGRRGVIWMVLREALLLVAIGGAIGVPLALIAGRSVASLLYGIPPVDPVSYIGAAALLVGVATLAASLPAFRASRIEPMEALGRN